MADTKISQLPAQTTLATNDVLPLVSTDNAETRKITVENAARDLVKFGVSVGTSAPNSPYTGQPWIDTSAATPLLKVYTGSTWAVSSIQPTSIVTSPGNSAPSNPTTGVLWLDTSATPVQLKAWDGSNWTQIDPDAVNRTASTGSAILPVGTTAQRDASPVAGYIRYNSTLAQFEGYAGAAWAAFGDISSAATIEDIGTNPNQIPLVQHLGSMAFQSAEAVQVGMMSANGAGGIGYGLGAGASVTQATSRTTGVTINAICGAITLVSAAGSASYQTFTVTNSAVAANDVVIISQKSGTDRYEAFVTAVGAGSFNITFATTGGTTTEQPVFNFAVIKASIV